MLMAAISRTCMEGTGASHGDHNIRLLNASCFCLWMQAFEAALEQDPKNAEVASRLGKCLVMVHEYR